MTMFETLDRLGFNGGWTLTAIRIELLLDQVDAFKKLENLEEK